MPNGAKSCPECGACDKSGWSGQAESSGLGLPDDDFDYRKFIENEFGETPKKSPMHWVWWLAAVLALLGFLLTALHR